MTSESLRGKRLLVLGSTSHIADIVRKAQKMGVETVVTDYNEYEKAPAKQISDDYLNISLADTTRLSDYVRTEEIDGILTGFTDSYIPFYLNLCDATGLPCYGSPETFEIAVNKEAFKKACCESGVMTIPGRCFDSRELFADSLSNIRFPALFKPSDNSGSRGVIKCVSLESANDAFDYAVSHSPAKRVICEMFMDCPSIGISYFISKGRPVLSSVCDRIHYRAKDTGSTIVSALVYPSRYLDRYIEEVHPAVIRMLSEHEFLNGMLSLQAFVDEDSMYQCEMCFRPSGGKHYVFIEDQTGVDELALLVEYALTGDMDSFRLEAENPRFAEQCLLVHVLGREGGIISQVNGFEELEGEEGVLRVVQHLEVGEVIGKDGTTAQTVATVWRKIPCGLDWRAAAERTIASLEVLDAEGSSLLLENQFNG